MKTFIATVLTMAALGSMLEPSIRAEDAINPQRLQTAIQRAIPLIEAGSAGSADQRECFTCHHQAIPIVALTMANSRGFAVDEANLDRQIQHTITHLQRGFENYEQGKGQGGQVSTAGYALFALDAAGWPHDESTTAVVHYVLQYQKQARRWTQKSKRPPTSDSDFTATFVALNALTSYGQPHQREAIKERREIVADWLRTNPANDTEDHVFRLQALEHVQATAEEIEQATNQLLSLQRRDGGWGQLPDMDSDAYATGTALYALMSTGGMSAADDRIASGLRYLLDTQQPDGTWHVVTRAEGFQTYFESGFPHDEDQFISMAASSWSVLSLMIALPDDQSTTISSLHRFPSSERTPGGGQ